MLQLHLFILFTINMYNYSDIYKTESILTLREKPKKPTGLIEKVNNPNKRNNVPK